MGFHRRKGRGIVGCFDGGAITSDGGAALLHEVECRAPIVAQLAGRFTDYHAADRVSQSLEALLAQRLYGLALGYED